MNETAKAISQWQNKGESKKKVDVGKFEGIVRGSMKKYRIGRKKAEQIAGRLYWKGAIK